MLKRFIYTVLSLSFTLLAANTAYCAEKASQAMKDALETYSKGQYSTALEKLNSLSSPESTSELTRYYKALCYQQTNQNEAAQKEYYWVYSQGKDASLKYKAWQGLKSIASRTKNSKSTASVQTDPKALKTAKAEKGATGGGWINAGEDYGYSGPLPETSFTFIRKQKACGRR